VAVLLAAAASAGFVAARHGAGWDDIQRSTGEKIAGVLPALLILLAIGMLIATWVLAGTIPCWSTGACAREPALPRAHRVPRDRVMSLFTGTSWGSAGTIGVALMGMAAALDAPLAPTAGAVVSGAYFGDKLSPLSDSTNICAIGADAPLYTHIRHMLYTALPSFVVAWWSTPWRRGGWPLPPARPRPRPRACWPTSSASSRCTGRRCCPPLIVVWSIVRRCRRRWPSRCRRWWRQASAWASRASGCRRRSVAAVSGFQVDMIAAVGDPAGSGRRSARSSARRPLQHGDHARSSSSRPSCSRRHGRVRRARPAHPRMLAAVRSVFGLVAATMAAGATMIALTSHGGVTALVIGGLFQGAYRDRGLAPENLSRSLEDSVTITEPLMPWTVSAVFMATTLGVPTVAYAPWAVFCYGGPIFSLLIAAAYRRTGWGLRRVG
jgi:Na+:H+ antiporter, NhaC family